MSARSLSTFFGFLLVVLLPGSRALGQGVEVSGKDLGALVEMVDAAIARGQAAPRFIFAVHPRTLVTAFDIGAHVAAAEFIGGFERDGFVRGVVGPNAEGSWTIELFHDQVLDPALARRWDSPEFVADFILRLTENPRARVLLNAATIPRLQVMVNGRPIPDQAAFRRNLLTRLPSIGVVPAAPPAQPSDRKLGTGDPEALNELYAGEQPDAVEVERPPSDAGTRQAAPPEPPARVQPPPPDVVAEIRRLLERPTTPAEIDVVYMRELFAHEHAAQIVAQEIARVEGGDWKNARLAEVREEMDRQVWRQLLSEMPTRIEHTNQGKANGIRSDRDYTLYLFLEPGSGVSVEDVIKRHGEIWSELHRMPPSRVEITVMNGEHFFPDWRNEALTAQEHIAEIRKNLLLLRSNTEAYWVPGANKEQVHNRALREGVTTIYEYDAVRDELVKLAEGRTSDLAAEGLSLRYTGVDGQFDYKNSMGNVLQNYDQFAHHEGDNATEATRRAKYFNRVINEGLGALKFFANSYQQIHESNLDPNRKLVLKRTYLQQALGSLNLTRERIAQFQQVIDLSMQIEADKKANLDYMERRRAYFADYLAHAERIVDAKQAVLPLSDAERGAMVLAEAEALFQRDQKRVMAYATLASLQHSALRDLTSRGILRNALKFQRNPQTGRVEAILDADRIEKVAFERAVEAGILFELAHAGNDPYLKSLAEAAIRNAPNEQLRRLYQQMSDVADSRLDHTIFDVAERYAGEVRLQLQEVLERKRATATRSGARLSEARLSDLDLRLLIETGLMEQLNGFERQRLREALIEAQRLSGPYVDELRNKLTPLMLGSSAINLIRAYQMGQPMGHAILWEMVWYAPDVIMVPFSFLHAYQLWGQGQYGAAAWTAGLMTAMIRYPALGEAMLAFNIVHGSFEIVRTHVIQQVENDMVRWALMARPHEQDGSAITASSRRARRNPYEPRQAITGDPPFFPLFYGPYSDGDVVINPELDGRVPEDELSDGDLARIAAEEFAPLIKAELDPAGLEPGSDAWEKRARELALRFGFEIPYMRRIEKVWNEKYQHVSPNLLEYLDVCRVDVHEWWDAQGQAYKDDIGDEARSMFGGGEDRAIEAIAQHCAQTFMAVHQAREEQAKKQKELEDELRTMLAQLATLENQLATTQLDLQQSAGLQYVLAEEERGREATALLEGQESYVRVSYPFTFATERRPPILSIEAIHPYSGFAQVAESVIDTFVREEMLDFRVGAPSGWEPEPEVADRFIERNGRAELYPVTVTHRFTVTVKDVNGALVGRDATEIPVVHYVPLTEFNGSIKVYVRGATESGRPEDSFPYEGAIVAVGDETAASQWPEGSALFGPVPPGTHAVTVAPKPGDERHGEASATAVLVDSLATPGAAGVESVVLEVVLPYIPPPPPELAQNPPSRQGGAGGGGGQPPTGGGGGGGGQPPTGGGGGGQPPTGGGGQPPAGGGEPDSVGGGGGGGQPPVGGGGEPDSLGGQGGQPDSLGAGGAGGGQPGSVGAGGDDQDGAWAPDFADLCEAMIVRTGENPQKRNSGPVLCSLIFNMPGTRKSFTMNIQRFDPSEDACVALKSSRDNMAQEPRAMFDDFEGRYGGRGYEASYGKFYEYFQGANFPHHSTFQVAFCRPPFFFNATMRYNGDEGAPVPDDIVADVRSRAQGTAERLGGAPAAAGAVGAQDPEAALVESLGPGPLDALREVNHLLQANSPVELLQSPGATGDRRRLLERIGKNPDSMTADEKRIYATFAWMAALANATDVNGRRAFPGMNASLSILLGLATTALTDSDPSRAHQAATAMDRYGAFLRRIDVQALQDRHAP